MPCPARTLSPATAPFWWVLVPAFCALAALWLGAFAGAGGGAEAWAMPVAGGELEDPPDPEEAASEPEVRVHLRDGHQITGTLLERTDEHVVVRVARIPMTIPQSRIDRLELLPSVMERYRQMREGIAERDVDQRVALARWLVGHGLHRLALKETEIALSVAPSHPEALRLKRQVEATIRLLERGRGEKREGNPPPDRREQEEPERPAFPLLSPEQINLLKVYELDMDDPPRLLVSRDTVRRLMESYAGHPLIPATREARDAMFRKRPAEILELMFRLRARELYCEVTVMGHPRSLVQFRDNVHRTMIINRCATDQCHGGSEAGRLHLYNRRPNSDATVYTNFYILDRFRTEDDHPLINYEAPHRSPLLQMGLPREDSIFPHPKVPGPDGKTDLYRPNFRSTSDRGFQLAVDWIRSVYSNPRPEYELDYPPRRPERGDEPADEPQGPPPGPDAGNDNDGPPR